MPISLKTKKNERLICSTGSGQITQQDFDSYHSSILNNPYIYGYNEILDLTAADLTTLNYSELLGIAETASSSKAFDPHSKLAIILKNKQQEEIIKLYQSARTFTTNPCRSMLAFFSHEDAIKWIDN